MLFKPKQDREQELDSRLRGNDELESEALDSGFRRNDELKRVRNWIPVFAGMTSVRKAS